METQLTLPSNLASRCRRCAARHARRRRKAWCLALKEPLRQIVENAGEDAEVVLNAVKAGKGAYGYNAANGEYGDMLEEGILDPTQVMRLALQDAASVAGLLLTTEVTVVVLPPTGSIAVPPPESPVAVPEPVFGAASRSLVGRAQVQMQSRSYVMAASTLSASLR